MLPLALSVRVAEYDEAVLLDVAGNIQRTGLPLRSLGAHGVAMLDHTPLYPFLLSLYAPAPGESLLLARGVTVLAALLCIGLTYKIGAVLGGRAAGFLAAAFVALNPFLAVYAYFVRMETFMVAFALSAVYTSSATGRSPRVMLCWRDARWPLRSCSRSLRSCSRFRPACMRGS
jgi:4-amino-4-deoxy-L-arabinose transferase-like glycosyltransferase